MSATPGPNRALMLLGGGGHAAVVADAARSQGWTVLGCLDDDEGSTEAARGAGLSRLGPISEWGEVVARVSLQLLVHAAVGDPALRRRWLEAVRLPTATVVHSSAVVSPSARIETGAFIGPRAVVNARAVVARGAIVNSGAIVEHDARVGAFAHLAPVAVLAGAAVIGEGSLVGAGAVVLPGVRIGSGAVLGAAAVATRDVAEGVTVAGAPARVLGRGR